MSTLYLYTKNKEIHVRIDDIHVSWTAPENLIRFVSTEQKPRCAFSARYGSCDKTGIVEKDYIIDLYEPLKSEGYNPREIVDEVETIKIGQGYLYNEIKTMDFQAVQQLIDFSENDEKEFWTMILGYLQSR